MDTFALPCGLFSLAGLFVTNVYLFRGGCSKMLSSGYFTWLKFLLGQSPGTLEAKIGYAPGSLREGWILLTPKYPIPASIIDLRGSTRWPDGKLPDGRLIGSLISTRASVAEAQEKVARFFDQGIERRPAKVSPVAHVKDYPPAVPSGFPQFKLLATIEWVAVTQVPAGGSLKLEHLSGLL